MKVKLSAVFVLCLLLCRGRASGEVPHQQENLESIHRIAVVVLVNTEALPEGAGQMPSEKRLQTIVELELRKACVPVADTVSEGKVLTVDSGPTALLIRLDSFVKDEALVIYRVQVCLEEVVLNFRATKKHWATIWSMDSFGYSGFERIERIEEAIIKLVQEFANDYLKANPKKSTAEAEYKGAPEPEKSKADSEGWHTLE